MRLSNASLRDSGIRLLFGEWLAERGDWRATGYLWLGRRRKEPSSAARSFDWWHEQSTNRREIVLPADVWDEIEGVIPASFANCKEFATLLDAELAVCQVLLSKPLKE
jgi:hypothetical protein